MNRRDPLQQAAMPGVASMRQRHLALAAAATVLLCGCQALKREIPDRWSAWRAYAGSPDSAQFSSLTQINRRNVASLQVAWTFPTGDKIHRSTPLIIDRVMYVVANGGVAALDAATGEQQWFAPGSISQYVRGLAYWQSEDGSERRLLVTQGHYLRALNARNGEVIASFGPNGRVDLREGLGRDTESIASIASMTPGRVFENLIILGSAVGDETYDAAPGDIRAYDVRSGKPVWTFHTIPHPGEFGYETWPADARKTVGGANAWSTLSLDEARAIVYVPTGAPSYHFYGADRAGDNLFSSSLIALDARSGRRLWHFQAVHHDIWDYDLAMAPKLLTIERQGRTIDAVALAGKHGLLFVFDRMTGEPLYPIEERPTPASDVAGEHASPTQPFPTTLPPFAKLTLTENELSPYATSEEKEALRARIRAARRDGLFTPPSFAGSVSAPGSRGGAQFGNGAVDPNAGLLYLAVIQSPTIPRLERRARSGAEHYRSSSAAAIYLSTCAACHGAEGRGQPPLIPALAGRAARWSDDQFLTIVQKGQIRMPAFAEIPDFQVLALRAYVNQLESTPAAGERRRAQVAAGRDLDVGDGEEQHLYRSGYNHLFSKDGLLLGPLPWSTLLAYDLNEGRILWQTPYGDAIQLARKGITGTGSLFPANSLAATAGGLLFSTTNDRKVRAWDRDTGTVLWSADLPADPGGIPAIYEVDGRQFVTVTATKGDVVSGIEPAGPNMYITYALPQ